MYSLTWCMTVILCSISQDCILLLGFEIETRFSFELILCSLTNCWLVAPGPAIKTRKLVLFREPQTFLMYWVKMEKI